MEVAAVECKSLRECLECELEPELELAWQADAVDMRGSGVDGSSACERSRARGEAEAAMAMVGVVDRIEIRYLPPRCINSCLYGSVIELFPAQVRSNQIFSAKAHA